MRKLPFKLRKNGFDYAQIVCCGEYYIYEQDYNSGIEYQEGDIPLELRFYEVFKVKVLPEQKLFGKLYPEREVFPSDEDFGISAWAFRSFDMSVDKLQKLNTPL